MHQALDAFLRFGQRGRLHNPQWTAVIELLEDVVSQVHASLCAFDVRICVFGNVCWQNAREFNFALKMLQDRVAIVCPT
jgi:hypothetical protein